MKTQKRKRRICVWTVALLLLVSLLPFTAFAVEGSESATPPYEKTLYQNGNWYMEYINVANDVRAIVGYRGNWDSDQEFWEMTTSIPITIRDNSIVTAIHVPYSYPIEISDLAAMTVAIVDVSGNSIGAYSMTPYLVQGEAEPVLSTDDEGNEIIVEAERQNIHVNYAVLIDEGLLLEKGEYFIETTDNIRIVRNAQTGKDGSVMVVGVDYDAWAKYMEQMQALGIAAAYDFTGIYRIDFDALKTSTLMGPVNPPSSSMALRKFELTVLDQGDTIQLVGKYEGIPFSQMCPVLERTENWVSASMDAKMDLTRLPYKAMIGGYGVIVLNKIEN